MTSSSDSLLFPFFFVAFQESVLRNLGAMLDNDTLETLTRAEQLRTNLTDLNIRIEGTKQLSHPNGRSAAQSLVSERTHLAVGYV